MSRPGRHLYDRPIGVLAALTALLVVGGLAIQNLAIDLWPPGLKSRSVWVRASMETDSSAEALEELARPLEGIVRGIPGIESVGSRIDGGRVRLVCSPADDIDTEHLVGAIDAAIAANLARLPAGSDPSVGTWGAEGAAVASFALGAGRHSEAAFEEILEDEILPALMRIPGVAQASYGEEDRGNVLIAIDADRSDAADLRPRNLVNELEARQPESLTYPARDGDGRRLMRTVNLRTDQGSADQLGSLQVRMNQRLDSLAAVVLQAPGASEAVLIDGQPGVVVDVHRSPDANGYRASARAEAVISQLADKHGLSLAVPSATHRQIDAAARELASSAAWGAVFAAVFLLLFLRRLRLTLLVCAAIPASLALAVVGLAVTGEAISIFTMVGFLLALGMLVDNSVVVGEALVRAPSAQQKDERLRLLRRAVGRVVLAILVSTATTVAIILPFGVMGSGFMSIMLMSLAMPVVWSLLGSLVAALVLVPLLYPFCYPKHRPHPNGGPWLVRLMERWYGCLLRRLLRNPVVALLLLAALITPLFVLGPQALQQSGTSRMQFDNRKVDLNVVVRGEPPMSHLTEVMASWMDTLAEHYDDLGIVATSVRITPSWGTLSAYLPPVDTEDRSTEDIADRMVDLLQPELYVALRKHLERARGQVDLSGAPRHVRRQQRRSQSMIRLEVQHPSADMLEPAWLALREKIKEVPGVTWAGPTPEEGSVDLELAVRPEAAAAGFGANRLAWQTTRWAGTRTVAQLDDATPILMGPLERQRRTLETLLAVPVWPPGAGDAPVRLEGVVDVGTVPSVGRIERSDGYAEQDYSIRVEAARKTAIMQTLLDPAFAQQEGIPAGTKLGVGWWNRAELEQASSRNAAMLLAVLVVYLLMGLFYESIIAPLAALAAIPLAVSSVVVWLGVMGIAPGTMVFIGVFFLIGIVVNNGIVLVDRLRRAVAPERCQPTQRVADALAGAARKRLAPVLLTSLTTVCAALPMALGSATIAGLPTAQLGWTVAVGLGGATIFTLFLVPLAYYWLARCRNGLAAMVGGRLGGRP